MPEARLDVLPEDGRAADPARHPAPAHLLGAGRGRRRPGACVMSVLRITGLRVSIAGKQILKGIDLEVSSGEVHAIMGPNGSGKSTLSHVLLGHPEYEVTGGHVTIDGEELLGLPTWQRAQKGLFLAMQYPIEVPGVSLVDA